MVWDHLLARGVRRGGKSSRTTHRGGVVAAAVLLAGKTGVARLSSGPRAVADREDGRGVPTIAHAHTAGALLTEQRVPLGHVVPERLNSRRGRT